MTDLIPVMLPRENVERWGKQTTENFGPLTTACREALGREVVVVEGHVYAKLRPEGYTLITVADATRLAVEAAVEGLPSGPVTVIVIAGGE